MLTQKEIASLAYILEEIKDAPGRPQYYMVFINDREKELLESIIKKLLHQDPELFSHTDAFKIGEEQKPFGKIYWPKT